MQLIYASALARFQRALQGSPDSDLSYKVRRMYESGLGTRRDLSTAKQYYTEAATEGNIHAQQFNRKNWLIYCIFVEENIEKGIMK